MIDPIHECILFESHRIDERQFYDDDQAFNDLGTVAHTGYKGGAVAPFVYTSTISSPTSQEFS